MWRLFYSIKRWFFNLKGFFRLSNLIYPLGRRKSYHRIPIEDELSLSLWDKWRKYKQFPYKFVVHCCLVIVITIQCIIFASQRVPFLLATNSALAAAFKPEGEINDSDHSFITKYGVIDSIQKTVEKYYNFPRESVDHFTHLPLHHHDHLSDPSTAATPPPPPPRLTLATYQHLNMSSIASHDIVDRSHHIEHYPLPLDRPLGPLASPSVVQSLFDVLAWLSVEFRLRTFSIEENVAECVVWHVTNRYEFRLISKISNIKSLIRAPLFWTNTIIAVLSILSFVLTFFALFRAFRLYKMSQREGLNYTLVRSFYNFGIFRGGDLSSSPEQLFDDGDDIVSDEETGDLDINLENHERDYNNNNNNNNSNNISNNLNNNNNNHGFHSFNFSSIKERLQLLSMFLRMWLIITLLGDILNIVASIMIYLSLIQRNLQNVTLTATVLGLSAMFTWINIIKYLEHAPKFYLLINALRKGMPNVIRFLIGALPVFVGYALCGTMLFGTYAHYFSSLDRSAVTLFAVLNGDVIHDVFDMIYGQSKIVAVFSRIYLYSFICLFIYAVLNIFILIMEDAFFSLKGSAIHPAYPPPFSSTVSTEPVKGYSRSREPQHSQQRRYHYRDQYYQSVSSSPSLFQQQQQQQQQSEQNQYQESEQEQQQEEYYPESQSPYGTFIFTDIDGKYNHLNDDNDRNNNRILMNDMCFQLEQIHKANNLTFAQRQALEKVLFIAQRVKHRE